MSDIRLYRTPDGGEIDCVNGQLVLDDGVESAVNLSLFGGNEADSGLPGDDGEQFWGNVDETDQTRKLRSELQNLLRSLPATSNNMKRVEDAAAHDLEWMLTTGFADSITASVSIPKLNFFQLDIAARIKDRTFEKSFLLKAGVST